MIIVNLKTFLDYPPGTVYSKYEPCVFDGLMIKGDSCKSEDYNDGEPFDWFYQDLIGNVFADGSDEELEILVDAEENKSSFELDFYVQERDGLFDKGQLFAVYEKEDVKALIKRLQKTLEL